MGLAARGARVCVVTIDPARRLADALGHRAAGHRAAPRRRRAPAGHGIAIEGELWAMMLDPKRTFDELIERLAPDEATRDEILDNRIYRELSGAVAGSQEFTAVAKLYDLDRSGALRRDRARHARRRATPWTSSTRPTASPASWRAARCALLLAPSGLAARVVGRGTSVVFGVLGRLTGVDLMTDLRSSSARWRPCWTASASAPRGSRRCWPTRRRRS